jgi:uncharacterized protein DUF6159
VFDKISRSFTLAGQCWTVLIEDPALLVFPLSSALAIVLLLASFAAPVWTAHQGLQSALAGAPATHTARTLFYAGVYVFYVISYSIVMFFNAGLVAVAIRRLDGESASVGEGLRIASSNLPAILGYALIAATVGTLLRVIEQRVGIVGRIVTAIIGAAWTIATAMTLPVLVVENVGPLEAISRSLDLLRKNWGENLIGNTGIGIGTAAIAIPLFILALGFAKSGMPQEAMVLLAVTVFGLLLVSPTLHAIYIAALYRFATGSTNNAGIDQDLLTEAFRQK